MNGRTNRMSIEWMSGAALAVILCFGLALLCAAPSWAQSAPSSSKTATHAAASAANAPTSRAKPKGGNHEGITVHGHWIIEVKNRDGSIASRTEFENSLQPAGADLLTGLLSGEYVAGGGFEVGISGTYPIPSGGVQGPGLCGNSGGCTLIDSRNPQNGTVSGANGSYSGYLTYQPNAATGSNLAGGFTLTGTVLPSSGGTIAGVLTGVGICFNAASNNPPNAVASTAYAQKSPQQCQSVSQIGSPQSQIIALTAAPVTQTVGNGQSVAVSVTISFSSPGQ